MATAITASGDQYQCIIRNEDNFSLQLQSTDGVFHFLLKADLKTIDRARGSMMPSDYAFRLSEAQLNDIASYLLNLRKSSTPTATQESEKRCRHPGAHAPSPKLLSGTWLRRESISVLCATSWSRT